MWCRPFTNQVLAQFVLLKNWRYTRANKNGVSRLAHEARRISCEIASSCSRCQAHRIRDGLGRLRMAPGRLQMVPGRPRMAHSLSVRQVVCERPWLSTDSSNSPTSSSSPSWGGRDQGWRWTWAGLEHREDVRGVRLCVASVILMLAQFDLFKNSTSWPMEFDEKLGRLGGMQVDRSGASVGPSAPLRRTKA